MANSQHVLMQQMGGAARFSSPRGYTKGESLVARTDVDLQVEDAVVSVPAGTKATVEQNNSQQLLLNLGEELGKFVIDLGVVEKYFDRPKVQAESREYERIRPMTEAGNPTVATPGAYVEITAYDPKIGPNRGPKSPGFGGYQTLIGQKGQIATLYNINVPGIMTYKVQLEKGGEFIFGDTEFKVINNAGTQRESVDSKPRTDYDAHALMGLGYGL
jgi:uncharacterized protein (DUF779 family)